MSVAERPELAVVVASHNTRALLRGCLQSLRAAAGVERLELWVVDDRSRDGSAAMVGAEFPEVRLIATERNLRVAAAAAPGPFAERRHGRAADGAARDDRPVRALSGRRRRRPATAPRRRRD